MSESRIATVLYEDKQQRGPNGFPLHTLVLAMLSDETGIEIHKLSGLVDGIPRNGVDKAIADLKRTSSRAGSGRLILLLDQDRISEHVFRRKGASEDEIREALVKLSDAPSQVSIYFLYPNLEGLLRTIQECGAPDPAPTAKNHSARDIYLKHTAYRWRHTVSDCLRRQQSGAGSLVEELRSLISLR